MYVLLERLETRRLDFVVGEDLLSLSIYIYICIHKYTYIHIYMYICIFICLFVNIYMFRALQDPPPPLRRQ